MIEMNGWARWMTRSRRSPKYRLLNDILAEKRVKAGLTQRDLAELLNRPHSFISKYESGERRLDVIELIEVSAALGCNPLEIIEKLMD